MRTPKISTKRVLGLGLAVALAVGTTLAVASSSQATSAPAAKISPTTGPAANTTQVVTVTGKGFMSGSTSQVGSAEFDTAACTSYHGTGFVAVTSTISVISATKLDLTTPSLALGSGTSNTYYLCVFDNTASKNLLGQAKYVVYSQPTVSALSTSNLSDLGGTSVDITGTHFDSKAAVTFDGVKATKVTYTSATAITAVAPPHAPSATAINVVVSTEGGNATAQTATYVSAIKVSPTTGTDAATHTIDITGSGFTPTNATSVTLTGAGTATCTNFRLVSSTEVTCDVGSVAAANDGAYTVQVTDGTTPTVISSGATYTIADF